MKTQMRMRVGVASIVTVAALTLLVLAPHGMAAGMAPQRHGRNSASVDSTAPAAARKNSVPVSPAKDAPGGKSYLGNGHTAREIKEKLQARIKHFEAKNESVDEVAGELQDLAEVMIVFTRDPQWKSVPTVTFNLSNVTVETILNRMASQSDIAWMVAESPTNSVVYVSSKRLVRARMNSASRTPAARPARSTPASAGQTKVAARLETRVPRFTVSDQPIGAVLDKLSKAANVRIDLDPSPDVKGLQNVTLDLTDAQPRVILDLATNVTYLKWTVLDDRVFVSDKDGVLKALARQDKGRK